jgi:hypothetical protein
MIDKATRRRSELIQSITETVFALGGWVVSGPMETLCLRIEARQGSDLPALLSASGWKLVNIGQNERLMPTHTEKILDKQGRVIRTVSHDGPAQVDVWQLALEDKSS